MNHQISTVPQVIPQVAYQSPQALTQLMIELPFVDSGFAVPVFSPGDDPIACLNKAMAFLTAGMNMGQERQMRMVGSQCEGIQFRQLFKMQFRIRVFKCFGNSEWANIVLTQELLSESKWEMEMCSSSCMKVMRLEKWVNSEKGVTTGRDWVILLGTCTVNQGEGCCVASDPVVDCSKEKARSNSQAEDKHRHRVLQTDNAPVYDSDGSAEVHNYDNCYDNEIFNMFTKRSKKRLKSDFKIRKDELLDKQIQLENKIKELDNILVKTEAAKFVRDFKSLAKEADESLAKHKTLELEIERL
ncbi:hypothetical protein Tco_0560576 [Tanacetum coccineum]